MKSLTLGILILAFTACIKKETKVQTAQMETVLPPPVHEPTVSEKKMMGNWVLDSSQRYELVKEIPTITARINYVDTGNCRIRFTGQWIEADYYLMEDGLTCSPQRKKWKVDAKGQLIINDADDYPSVTVAGTIMSLTKMKVDGAFYVMYYLHRTY